jgi:signal peptidase I
MAQNAPPPSDNPALVPDQPRRFPWWLILVFVVVLIFISTFYLAATYERFYIPAESMEPTLMGHEARTNSEGQMEPAVHDQILANKWTYRSEGPKRLDIIVFKAPKEADQMALSEHREPQENILTKRVIGLPGETVEVKTGPDASHAAVFINGKALTEPYIREPMELYGNKAVDAPLKLGPGEYFVMGDNRNNSNDSRYWGVLERGRIIGKVDRIIAPLERQRAFP